MATLTQDQIRKYYDKTTYLANNSDLQQYAIAHNWGDTDLFNHYVTYGLNENRIASPIYIQQDYVANNPDVRSKGFENNWTSSDYLNDYITSGMAAGKVASHIFNATDYLALNADLTAYAAANPGFDPVNHYLTFGRNESNRTGKYIKAATAVDYTKETGNGMPSSGMINPSKVVLTNLDDQYTGTNMDDTFISNLDASGNPTFSSATFIDGLGGRDTITARSIPAGTLKPQLKNIQKISIKPTGAVIFDAANSPDLEVIDFSSSNYANTVQNVRFQGTEFSINNSLGAFNNNFKYSNISINPNKYSYLKLNNAQGTIAITNSIGTTGPAKLSINAVNSSSAVTITDTGSNLKTLQVTGNANLDLTSTTFTKLTSIDASTLTGGLAAKLSTSGIVTIRTGSGNDYIMRNNLTANDMIDLGTGNNTLASNSASILPLFSGTPSTKIVNITNIAITDPLGGNLDLSKLPGISNVTLLAGAGSGLLINNITSGQLITMGGGSVGSGIGTNYLGLTVVNPAGSTDPLSLNLDLTTSNNYFLGTNVANLTLQADAAANVQITDSNLVNLTVRGLGSANVAYLNDVLPSSVKTVDATGLVGNFNAIASSAAGAGVTINGTLSGVNTITDGAGNDTIIGGTTGDNFFTNMGVDTYTGNGGNNTYNIGRAAAGTYNDVSTPGNKVIITDFNFGTSSSGIDNIGFSIGGFTQTQVLIRGSGAAIASGAAVATQAITSNNAATINSTTNLILYENGSYVNAAALQTVLNNSATKLSFSTATSAAGAILVAYNNSTDGCIDVALVKVGASAADTSVATVQDIISLQGVTSWANIDNTDFAFIS